MGTAKELHPSVKRFKEFVSGNPQLIRQVRNGDTTWQQLYEEWYLLGEEDPRWAKGGTGEGKANEKDGAGKDWLGQLGELAKKVEPAKVQSHLYNLSHALGAIQGLISQFQSNAVQQEVQPEPVRQTPFPFRKD